MKRNPTDEELALTDEEYADLKSVSHGAINHITVNRDTDLYLRMLKLLNRNMVRGDLPESKTSVTKHLKRNPDDSYIIEKYRYFWIGGGTFGHRAIERYENEREISNRL